MLVAGIILFALLVVVHELGHFLVAKRNGVEVEEFGIGFPPKIASKVMGRGIWRTRYSFNLLPLGGFVRLKGENEADNRPGSFGSAPFAAKARITFAGIAMNYFVAILLISIVAAIRLPVLFEGQFSVGADAKELRRDVLVTFIAEDSPAQQAGIDLGDTIISFDGVDLNNAEQLSELTRASAGEDVSVVVDRAEGGRETINVSLMSNPEDGQSFLGVGPRTIVEQRYTWSAPIVGFVVTNQLIWETLRLVGQAVGDLLAGNTSGATVGVTGPVGIVAIFREISSMTQLLLITGLISLSLAVMNALPIPALDGGRLALSGLFKVIRKPLKPEVENAIHGFGFILLITLVILISIADVQRFF